MNKVNEKFLLYRVRTKQDPDAFGQLYDGYVDKIFRFVYLKISHRQDAEDLTSDVFLKTWNYLVQEDQKSVDSFSGFVYGIARNSVVDWYRKKSKIQECQLDGMIIRDYNLDIGKVLDLEIESIKLINTIKTLKQDYQDVILLRYIEELSISEIAKILDKRNASVRVTLHRAKEKLKSLLTN
ncbi:RNA polymerase sigma factor [Patescibacteria group bacterium]|nr:RNA polymerase sigma factor [Patescibacteria group bacterium]